MENMYIIGGVITSITQIVLLIFCIILVLKKQNTATILMLIGSILSILFAVLNIVWTAVASRNGPEAIADSVFLLNILKTIPYLLFVIGFGLFVIKNTKKIVETTKQE